MERFVISDHHFGHNAIIKYANRPFETPLEMFTKIIDFHNEVVKPTDKVYFLGDVAWTKEHLKALELMNGKKVLIKGNHDLLYIKEYLKYFEDIRANWVYEDMIFTHIPIHPDCFEDRYKLNIHGHLHEKKMYDTRYFNACVEALNYRPKSIMEIRLEKIGNK